MVDNEGFKQILKRQVPDCKIPASDTLRLTTLPKVYNEVKRSVIDCLSTASTICLMFDGWSDKHNTRHFLGIRAAFIADDWSGRMITLSCKTCPQDAQSMSEQILNELADVGLTADAMKSKRLFTTHDGDTAMLKTSRLLQSQFY